MLATKGLVGELSILLAETWQFFIANIVGIVSVLIPVLFPLVLLSAIPAESDFFLPGVFLSIALYPIYQGAVILHIAAVATNEPLALKQYYSMAGRSWLALIILYIFSGVALSLGVLLFVIPVFIVLGRVAFAEFHCLLESKGGSESFSLSWETTKPVQMVLIIGLAIIVVGVGGFHLLVEFILSELGLWNLVFSMIIDIVFSVMYVLITIFSFRVYQLESEKHQQSTG